jgi:U3 small nucleolar RNA-associated protein 21
MPAAVERPAKRAKVVDDPAQAQAFRSKQQQPRLFAPFRALGYISNHVPFALQVQSTKGALSGPHVTIVSSLGKSWAMWDAGKMGLVFVGACSGRCITS